MTLAELTALAAGRLPPTAGGVRAAGDPDRLIRTLAVCGGAGDSFLAAAGRGGRRRVPHADLRHHPASEHLAAGGPALLDAAHWATERPWLDDAGRLAARSLPGRRLSCPTSTPTPGPCTRSVENKESRREGRPASPAPPARPAGHRHRPGPARPPPQVAAGARGDRHALPRAVRAGGRAGPRPGRRRRPRPRHRPLREGHRAGPHPQGPRPGPAERRRRAAARSRPCSTSWPRSTAASPSWRTPSWS